MVLMFQAALLAIGLVAIIGYALWTLLRGPYVLGSAFVGALIFIDVVIAMVLAAFLACTAWLLKGSLEGSKRPVRTFVMEGLLAAPFALFSVMSALHGGAVPLTLLTGILASSTVVAIVLTAVEKEVEPA